jgi:plasmid stability protein
MAQVLVRNIAEETVESYRQKAKIKGISLEQELRDLMERNKSFTPEERVAISRRLRAEFGELQRSLTLDEIREGLE